MTNGTNYKEASYIIVLGIVISVLPISSTVVSLVFWHADFIVYMNGHPQVMVVLYPSLLVIQGVK
jgi:hypothetical protein